MSGVTDPATLVAALSPRLREGRYVFATIAGAPPPDIRVMVMVAEDEGTTLVVPAEDAAAAGLTAEFPCAWITLAVDSDLAAVGLLAAVTRALAGVGIPVNAVAGFHHDHLFVPEDAAARAMDALVELTRS